MAPDRVGPVSIALIALAMLGSFRCRPAPGRVSHSVRPGGQLVVALAGSVRWASLWFA